ncbi:hypothetical protein [Streptomyces sp. N35]|uniref:hypothetical protein n=1 Tax=Streptomyces sp. N35 TaxID=2795730 RepID=UPI0018F45EFA|nr:hypothetical protein [Streptomyces sp. N35]
MTYEELIGAWSEVAYDRLPEDEQDRLALDCAREMVAAAGGERAYQWVFGQVLMLPHTELAGGDVPQVEAEAARAVRRASPVPGCAREEHPYDEEWVDLVDWNPDRLRTRRRCWRSPTGASSTRSRLSWKATLRRVRTSAGKSPAQGRSWRVCGATTVRVR